MVEINWAYLIKKLPVALIIITYRIIFHSTLVYGQNAVTIKYNN